MNNITVSDAKREKEKLSDTIKAAILNFEKITGAIVHDISVEKISIPSYSSPGQITNVKLDIRL